MAARPDRDVRACQSAGKERCPPGKSAGGCETDESSGLSKNIRLCRRANQWLFFARSAPDHEGRFAIVTDVGRGMRWTLGCARDECAARRTAKSCGLDVSTLALTRIARGWWQESPITRESTKEAVKTVAQGEPDDPDDPVVTNSYVFHFYIRGYGCIPRPAFPAPSDFSRATLTRKPRRLAPRERMRILAPALRTIEPLP
jgi:hypothetical protein